MTDIPAAKSLRFWRLFIRHREVISTILMGMSAVVTTWCAFESTKWGGIQSIRFAEAAAARTESTRNEVTANQELQVDISTFLAWLAALEREMEAGNVKPESPYRPDPSSLSGFIYLRFRKDFRPAVQAWVATRPLRNPDAPPTPFVMPEYKRPLFELAQQQAIRSDQQAEQGRRANQNADNYMLTTVIAALAVFFAGMSTSLELPQGGLVLLLLGLVSLFACLVLVLNLPIAL